MSTAQLPPGSVIDRRFTIGNAVRTREGATVYDATDSQSGPCSVTVYDASCFPSGLVLERSLRELRQLQAVVSPRVVPVLAAGKVGDGIFEATAQLPAQTLTETLAGGPLSLQDAAGLVVQVGEALLEAQRAGVIHRDLGGDVVFPSPDGVKVTGFAVGEPMGPGSFGSLHCIAPEQVEGKVVDQRTLIYNVAALMHWMLTGTPLFAGDRPTVLAQHATGDPPSTVHARLRRALGKDPRMRPMMLKQFLGELASLGGVEPPRAAPRPVVPRPVPAAKPPAAKPPAASPSPVAAPVADAPQKPSSRGWTMFMKAQDEEPEAPAPASHGVGPTGPEGGVGPTGPEGAGGETSPSTRGWTMFMKAQEDDVPTPRETTPAAPAPAPAPAPGDKPSTRGWTMFMQAQDEEAAPAEPGPASTPAPEAGEAKPSTRGWTMFMKEGDEAEPAPGTPGSAGAEASPPSAAAPVGPSGPQAPMPAASPPGTSPTGPSAEPSTRGWTMFMKEGEEQPPAVPEQTPRADSGQAAGAPLGSEESGPRGPRGESGPRGPRGEPEAAAPSTRGWTIFTDPAATTAPAKMPPTPTAATPTPSRPPSDTSAARTEMAAPLQRPPAAADGSGPIQTGEKKRGWTMFMDAPLADLAQKAPPPQPVPELETPTVATIVEEPPGAGASDKKGWTVFGEPSPTVAVPEPAPGLHAPPGLRGPSGVASVAVTGSEAPERGKTVMYTGTPPAPRPYQGEPPAEPAPESAVGQAAKVVAHGMAAQTGPGGGVTGRTMAAGAGGQPDTMYFKRGQTEPEKPASPRATTARDIEPPASLRPVEERAPRTTESGSPGPRGELSASPSGGELEAAGGGGSKVIYIVLGVVVLGAAGTAAFFAFT